MNSINFSITCKVDDEEEKRFLEILNSSPTMQQKLIMMMGAILSLSFGWDKALVDSYVIKKIVEEKKAEKNIITE